jgi:hypothetical protein
MDAFISALVNQVPDLAALIAVVIIFLNRLQQIEERHSDTVKALQDANSLYLQKRDEIYISTVTQVGQQLEALSKAFEVHDQKMTDAVTEMHRVAGKRKP